MRILKTRTPKKYLEAARMYAEGEQVRYIRRFLGVSHETIYRWLRDPEFVELADDLRSEYYHEFFGKVAVLAEEALQKTVEIMRSKKAHPNTVLSAALKIMDINERAAKDRLLVKEQLYSLTNKERLAELSELIEDEKYK
jgi:transposase